MKQLTWIDSPYPLDVRVLVKEKEASIVKTLWEQAISRHNYPTPANEREGILQLKDIIEQHLAQNRETPLSKDIISRLEKQAKELEGSPVRGKTSSKPYERILDTWQAPYGKSAPPKSSLNNKFFLSFAGQANDYLKELRQLWQTSSLVQKLLRESEQKLEQEILLPDARRTGYFRLGMKITQWLDDEKLAPASSYLASSGVSQPLIFLTQIAHFLAFCEATNLAPEQIRNWACGITGHSQGMVPAALVASGFTVETLLTKSVQTACYLLWQGIRMQEVVRDWKTGEKWRQQAIGDLGTPPGPMVALGGITEQELEKLLVEFASQSSDQRQIYLALDNGPFKKIISGHPETLEKFRIFLRNKEQQGEILPRREIFYSYLATSSPFHSPYIEKGLPTLHQDIERIGWHLAGENLQIPLYSCESGDNLQNCPNFTKELVRIQSTAQVRWSEALQAARPELGVTHLLDFGPGEAIAKITQQLVNGYGVAVIPVVGKKTSHFLENLPTPPQDWRKYSPKWNPKTQKVENAFTRLTGRAPIILPGMTPTTVTSKIVSAASNAGFLAELAGGGQVTAEMFRQRMQELSEQLEPGQGIVINTLYLDPYLWNLHVKKQGMIFQLKQEGFPIWGVTISAGVPEVDEAAALLDKFHQAGIFLNAFKPGTDQQIEQILAIADACPQYTICMHIEGGLAGGHHGWYSLERLLARNYSKIRARSNIVVLAGGGIREEKDAIELISGQWSEKFSLPPMPVDGVFLGTLAMATQESEASLECKKALVAAPGTEDWFPAGIFRGGMISGKSPLDADIYYLENDASRVGQFLDSLVGKPEQIAANKDKIIKLLNRTAKPYFGELREMSYIEVLERMVTLMAIGNKQPYEDGIWLDKTYRSRFVKMLKRTLARFALQQEIVFREEDLQQPQNIILAIAKKRPKSKSVPLSATDASYFLQEVCRAPGKPVNFVPVIDENIRRWYKSDSLHFCNHPKFTAEQVFQTPGPRAIGGITKLNEPVAELFSRFEKALAQHLTDNSAIASEEEPITSEEDLVGHLMASPALLRDGRSIANYLVPLFQENENYTVVKNPNHWRLLEKKTNKELACLTKSQSHQLEFTLWHFLPTNNGSEKAQALRLAIDHNQAYPPANFQESSQQTTQAIADFYRRVMPPSQGEPGLKQQDSYWLSESKLADYLQSIDHPFHYHQGQLIAPISMAFVLAWRALFALLLEKQAWGNLLQLVHLSNRIWKVSHKPLVAQSNYQITSALSQVQNSKEGKVVTIQSVISRDNHPLIEMESQFLIRQAQKTDEQPVSDLPKLFAAPSPSVSNLAHPITTLEDYSVSPVSSTAYALASDDFNPLHSNPLLAKMAGFSEPILHGMWLKGNVLSALAEQEQQVESIEVSFTSPLLAAEPLLNKFRHVALDQGKQIWEVTANAQREQEQVPLLTGKVTLAPEKAALVFPGQGIQQTGMGQESRKRSQAAREVWQQADEVTRTKLGFSILQVVDENPTELTVTGKLWTHPKGVLFLTQFTQVALVAHALASVAEMREAGIYQQQHVFCGHSIGEYSALAACQGVLALEDVIQIVYQRGLTMQNFVPRDDQGRSPYQMGVILPHRAGLGELEMIELVNRVRKESKQSLEIVNYNIRGRQYSIVGHHQALELLKGALAQLSNPQKPAYIEVPGIDVPFHSPLLLEGVGHFRQVLQQTFAKVEDESSFTGLIGHYIPNLVAQPFAWDKEFLEETYRVSQSPIVAKLLEHYPQHQISQLDSLRKLLIELLAYQFAYPVRWIETQDLLLGQTLAVRKIIEVGVGYQPTLYNMLAQTLQLPEHAGSEVSIANLEKNHKELFFATEGEAKKQERANNYPHRYQKLSQPEPVAQPQAEPAPGKPAATSHPVKATAEKPPQAAPKPTTTSQAPQQKAMPFAIHSLRTILALHAKVWPEEIQATETIDDLLGGNSSRRNQVLVDLWTEFNISPIDGAHEIAFQELETAVAKATTNRYQAPGPFLRVAHNEAVKKLLAPAGLFLQDIIDFWQQGWEITEPEIFQLLSLITLAEKVPVSNRSGQQIPLAQGPLKSTPDAEKFLQQIVEFYSNHYRQIPAKKQASSSEQMVGSEALDKALNKYFGAQGAFMELARFLQQTLGFDPYAALIERDKRILAQEPDLYSKEHGKNYEKAIQPRFNPETIRHFRSSWNWVRCEAFRLFLDLSQQNLSASTIDQRIAHIASHPTANVRKLCQALESQIASHEKDKQQVWQKLLTALSQKRTGQQLAFQSLAPQLTISQGQLSYQEVPRENVHSASDFVNSLDFPLSTYFGESELTSNLATTWKQILQQQATEGVNFQGKVALVTGASPHSIALAIVQNLLRGGAKVILTTTTANQERWRFYKEIYQQSAAHGGELHVVTFNQGSFQDIQQLIEWIYQPEQELQAGQKFLRPGWQLDYIIPFAAVSEENSVLTLDEHSLATLRVLLVGVEKLIGSAIKAHSQSNSPKKIKVVLPFSPNHGQFGYDGFYGETKAALEVLMQKWLSEREAWGKHCQLLGANIGWVRGTSLMAANDLVASSLEQQTGVRTFSVAEMGFLLTALLAPQLENYLNQTPIKADLSGGMAKVTHLGERLRQIRTEIQNELKKQRSEHHSTTPLAPTEPVLPLETFDFPEVEMTEKKKSSSFDLDNTVVIVGFGEVGAFGNSRMRWSQEKIGQIAELSAVELAKMLDLIEFSESPEYVGWIDKQTQEKVAEHEIPTRYQEAFATSIGIREVDPEAHGFDPRHMKIYSEVPLENDLHFTVEDEASAQRYHQADPENTEYFYLPEEKRYKVILRAGKMIRVPKKGEFNRTLGAQIPKGWRASRFGLPLDLEQQIDRNTHFNLVGTSEAFLSAGLEPQELYQFIHPARVGNTQGSGMGGMRSLSALYRSYALEQPRANDCLQETLTNVMGAYAVQNLVGSYGPMVAPANACATAAVSAEIGVEKILTGKADFVVTGGYDDISDAGYLGFIEMNATANSEQMQSKGYAPQEISRPNDSTRDGFVEAQGGGSALLARASTAIKMGLPIYGVLAMAISASDGIHTSIPAPGLGLLHVAAETEHSRSILRKSLNKFGLDIDDVTLVSKHDTSTHANDLNESELYQHLFANLKRKPGLPAMVVSQKSLTGHCKGGAASWQLNGILQAMNEGVVPGNNNLTDVDPRLQKHDYLLYNDKPLTLGQKHIKAALLTSLGFGHVGAMLCLVHPDCFWKYLPIKTRQEYLKKREQRWRYRYHREHQCLIGKEQLIKIRKQKPFQGNGTSIKEQEIRMLLNPQGHQEPNKR